MIGSSRFTNVRESTYLDLDVMRASRGLAALGQILERAFSLPMMSRILDRLFNFWRFGLS